jgi:heme/copper-type cytochrome/quinol oxidase subunit 2
MVVLMIPHGRHRLAVALSTCATLAAGASSQPRAPQPRVIHIVAERFTFTPASVTVDQGSAVELRLTSDDTSHGFRLIGPGEINVEIPKRGRGEVRVALDTGTPGRYVFECSQICGAGHDFMRGTIEVRPR